MKSYAFALQKGGTGKTSISVSVAVELANKGKKVVYIDCDPQGNSSSWLLNDFDHELADVLYEKIPVLECVYKSDIENLYVIPTFGVGGELKQWAKKETFPFIFQKTILPALELHFDYCIFDTSPNFDDFEENIMSAADEALAVVMPDIFSQDGLQIFENNLQNFKKRKRMNNPVFKTFVFNAVNLSTKMAKDILAQLSSSELNYVTVPQDQNFRKAQGVRQTIQQFGAKPETISSFTKLAGLVE